jgi:hypothetical protein
MIGLKQILQRKFGDDMERLQAGFVLIADIMGQRDREFNSRLFSSAWAKLSPVAARAEMHKLKDRELIVAGVFGEDSGSPAIGSSRSPPKNPGHSPFSKTSNKFLDARRSLRLFRRQKHAHRPS